MTVGRSEVWLEREGSGPWGTFGRLQIGDWRCCTLEPAWKGNARSISCIPGGTYTMRQRQSPVVERTSNGRFPRGWEVCDVPERSYIMVHPGNWVRNTDGCILVGRSHEVIRDQRNAAHLPGVTSSQATFADLMELLAVLEEWTLHILWQDVSWP